MSPQSVESSASEASFVTSNFANDPDLRDIIQMFVDEMPYRTALLEELFQSGQLEELHRVIHELTAAAGNYGFPSIAQAASQVEKLIEEEAPYEQIRSHLEDLLRLCSLARFTPAV